jgi:hypothetical protein
MLVGERGATGEYLLEIASDERDGISVRTAGRGRVSTEGGQPPAPRHFISEGDVMTILKNAIDSIDIGIEDYNSDDPRRLTSATRNIVAGILLLFKHKLAELSPADSDEVLLKSLIEPKLNEINQLHFKGKGRKTVDVNQIQDRFKSLGVAVDWEKLKNILEHRNNIEHYFSNTTHESLRGYLSDSMVIIRDFTRTQLNLDPAEIFSSQTWSSLIEIEEVYRKEKIDCAIRISSLGWLNPILADALFSWSCDSCGSGLLDIREEAAEKNDTHFFCRSCSSEHDFCNMSEHAVRHAYVYAEHHRIKDGGDPAIILCPNCGLESYDLEEDVCLICDESTERECSRCGAEIPWEEIDGEGLCGWCAHMIEGSIDE